MYMYLAQDYACNAKGGVPATCCIPMAADITVALKVVRRHYIIITEHRQVCVFLFKKGIK